jgi:hypothetical protein
VVVCHLRRQRQHDDDRRQQGGGHRERVSLRVLLTLGGAYRGAELETPYTPTP